MKTNENSNNYIANYINDIIEVNNKYKNKNYNIFLEKNYIGITHNQNSYKITILKNNNKLFWHLTPYNGSFFETEICTSRNSFEMLIYAIEDNEKLYK